MNQVGRACLLAILCTFVLGAQSRTDLFTAVRENDVTILKTSALDKADPGGSGSRSVTPLMHAAAFGSLEAMQVLIEAGVDVNAGDAFGATALLWAAGDAAKTRLLLEHKADPNIRTKRGRTPLLVAAAHDGSARTVALLLAHGADIKAAGDTGETALLLAAAANDLDTVKLLMAGGADANETDAAGNTVLMHAAAHHNMAMVKLLLAKGANVNAATTFGGQVRHGEIALKGLTPLMLAAPHGSVQIIRSLLGAGADPNARDSRGITTLMFAVASENQDRDVVRLLLSKGADVNVESHAGETALDWAKKFGNREVIARLQRAGGKSTAQVGPRPLRSGPAPADARQAVERSISLLQRSSKEFFQQSGCVSCHHQNAAQMATGALQLAGLRVNEADALETTKGVTANWGLFQDSLLERLDAPGSPDSPVFSAFALALEKAPADLVTDTLAAHIASFQFVDGSWKLAGFSRAPIEESNIARTAMAMRVLQVYATPGRKREFESRSQRARVWLQKAPAKTTDDHVWRLLGLFWGNSQAGKVRAAAKQLLKLQRADGGWGQNRNLESDAYGTGTALWALYTAGALQPSDSRYQRGVQYLLSSQLDDGSWYVRSRAPKFQPYFESGFPHGHDQWISAMGTAWATMALAPAAQTGAIPPGVTD